MSEPAIVFSAFFNGNEGTALKAISLGSSPVFLLKNEQDQPFQRSRIRQTLSIAESTPAWSVRHLSSIESCPA